MLAVFGSDPALLQASFSRPYSNKFLNPLSMLLRPWLLWAFHHLGVHAEPLPLWAKRKSSWVTHASWDPELQMFMAVRVSVGAIESSH